MFSGVPSHTEKFPVSGAELMFPACLCLALQFKLPGSVIEIHSEGVSHMKKWLRTLGSFGNIEVQVCCK